MTDSGTKNTKITFARVSRIIFGIAFLIYGVYLIMDPHQDGTFDKISGISFIIAGTAYTINSSQNRKI
jgi:uncharacterized membrane protein HdeD (DUF308 family)